MNGAAKIAWETAPEFLEVSSGAVHVWRATLDVLPAHVETLRSMLSKDEGERAARSHFERDRSRYIVGRACLRILIGRCLRKTPAEIQFGYGANGKPFVVGQQKAQLSFNLSHSGSLALYAVTRGREIGVDLERISALMDMEAIAERFFSRREVAALNALSPERRKKAFYVCWTRKEAYVKARGEGLTIPLDRFSVSLGAEEPPALEVQNDREESARWSLLALEPGPDYVGAVAVEGRVSSLKCWQLSIDFPTAPEVLSRQSAGSI